MSQPPLLSTTVACRVARMDRDHLNVLISSGVFACAPSTTPGRTRYFDPDDMIALYLFRELTEDGEKNERAGRVACAVAAAGRVDPDATTITFVENYFGGSGDAYPTSAIPAPEEWGRVLFSGTDIRKTTTFNIAKMRALIAHYTDEERRRFGPED